MNCIFLRRGYPEINKAPDYSDNFADNDWATIAAVCAYGLVPATWKIGDQKAMEINGVSYAIDIIGIQHDDFADGSGKAPFTFQTHDLYNENTYFPTSNLDDSVPSLFPSEIAGALKEVNKIRALSSSNKETEARKVFQLSEVEVFGTNNYSYSGEGTRYEYYAAGNSAIKKYKTGGSLYAGTWPLRSLAKQGGGYFACVTGQGTASYTAFNFSTKIPFTFCLGNKV